MSYYSKKLKKVSCCPSTQSKMWKVGQYLLNEACRSWVSILLFSSEYPRDLVMVTKKSILWKAYLEASFVLLARQSFQHIYDFLVCACYYSITETCKSLPIMAIQRNITKWNSILGLNLQIWLSWMWKYVVTMSAFIKAKIWSPSQIHKFIFKKFTFTHVNLISFFNFKQKYEKWLLPWKSELTIWAQVLKYII